METKFQTLELASLKENLDEAKGLEEDFLFLRAVSYHTIVVDVNSFQPALRFSALFDTVHLFVFVS